MHQCLKFILFWNDTVNVSDGLSVHQQQLKTVHTVTGICQTDTAVCLHLVGFVIEMYYDARPYERRISYAPSFTTDILEYI